MYTIEDTLHAPQIEKIAVVTADFIGSSALTKDRRATILSVMKKESKKLTASDFEIYRGDSFQGIIYDLQTSLAKVLQLKTAVNMLRFENDFSSRSKKIIADFRIAIGIGTRTFHANTVGESDGPAFQYSGRQLDKMKAQDRKIALITADQNINDEFDVSLKFLDLLMNKWSMASAEVVYYLLQGYKEVAIAKELGISQAAVNLRKKAAGWDAIVLLLKRYEQVTEKLV